MSLSGQKVLSLPRLSQLRHPGQWNEARIGIEPMYKGFADPRLTTWLPRHNGNVDEPLGVDMGGWDYRHARGMGQRGRT